MEAHGAIYYVSEGVSDFHFLGGEPAAYSLILEIVVKFSGEVFVF